jgi:hypothetical protein
VKKKRKKEKNRLEFRFASKQKVLNRKRSEKFKAKKAKKAKQMRKIAKKSEKKPKTSEKIDLKFASWAHYGYPPPA